MKRVLVPCLVVIASVWSCQNIENAEPTNRKTFIRSFEGPFSLTAVSMDTTAAGDGYVIMGTTEDEEGVRETVVMLLDKAGNLKGDIKKFGEGIGKSIKSYPGGYIVACDDIQIDPSASQVGNIEVSSMYLQFFNEQLEPTGSFTLADTDLTPNRTKTDIKSSAATISDDGSEILVLGTKQDEGFPQKPFILALKTSDFSVVWEDNYEILDLDFVNSKSVHYSGGNIIWASSILKKQGNFNESYISIPFVKEELSYTNNSTYGSEVVKALFANDIQPSRVSSFGYGVIGTNGETNGTGKDIFFARVAPDGTINEQSIAFLDGADGLAATAGSEDTGDALWSSKDGGFILAGSLLTNTSIGKGARDILLIRVDSFGEVIWKKLLGGSGDESVASVMETSDGGFLILGTNNIGGYSSIFVIKTDSKGELVN